MLSNNKKKNNLIKFLLSSFIFQSVLIIAFFLPLAPSVVEAELVLPEYSSFVNDYTGTLDPDWKLNTEKLCTDLEYQTGSEIAVAIISSLEGLTIEDYAVRL